MDMKIFVLVLLVVLGLYWLIDHASPLPLNHEQLGLYDHNIHRIIGVVLLVIAGIVGWKWKAKKS